MSDSLLYSPWNSLGQNTGVGSQSLLQGIFPAQVLNQGLLHCRWILYQLSHKGSPRILEWVVYPFSRGSSQPRNWTSVSCIAGRFFSTWAIREALAWKQTDNTSDIPAQANVRTRMCPLQCVDSEQREGAGPLGGGEAEHHWVQNCRAWRHLRTNTDIYTLVGVSAKRIWAACWK